VDNAGNIQDIVIKNVYLDSEAPTINSAFLGEPDVFYSPYTGNSIVNVYANITDQDSGIKQVIANFSGLSCGEKNMSYNNSLGLYETSCDVSSDAETRDFDPFNITILAYDNLDNTNSDQLLIVLYNMTTFQFNNSDCFRHGSLSTDFSQELDFNNINFIVDIEMNLNCSGFNVGWMKVALLNFTSINFSSPDIGSKLSNLASAINVTPKLPRNYGDSRIDINTTAFAELNTNTTITLYNLPFASTPNITADNSSKQDLISNIVWEQGLIPFEVDGEIIQISGGNLTFTVEGFSGYNITDSIEPTISIQTPSNGSLTRSSLVNIIANGTGTEISKVILVVVNGTTYYYNSTVQDITCNPIESGSDTYNCTINLTSLSDGNHTINVTAYDYGGTSGNSKTESITFELDKTAPVITFSLSTTTVYVGQTITATCTADDARDGTVNTTYTLHPSTSAAGTFTTTCTATDSAGNTVTSSLSYTVYNWPSGGGGSGGTGVIVPTASMIWAVLEADSENTFKISDKEIDVTEFSLSIKKSSSNVMVKIKKLGSRPDVVPEIKNVYSYLEIEKTNLQEENINIIKIKFKVSKKWLNEKGIAREEIVLNHYKNNKWNELPTIIKGEDSEFVYYEAETSSLSYFAIAQTSKPTTPTTTTTPTTPTPTPAQSPTPSETPVQTPRETQTPVKEKIEISNRTSLLILVVLIVVLLLLTYLIYRKKAFV